MTKFNINGQLDFDSLASGGARVILDIVYPVGTILEFDSDTNPNSIMHGQTWVEWGQGRVVIGAGSGTDGNNVTKTYTRGGTGGYYDIRLTEDQIPSHNHTFSGSNKTGWFHIGKAGHWSNGGGDDGSVFTRQQWGQGNKAGESSPGTRVNWNYTPSGTIGDTGGNLSHNNIQPYIVAKRWKRTA